MEKWVFPFNPFEDDADFTGHSMDLYRETILEEFQL